jgi:effector-binding domain-containing protein
MDVGVPVAKHIHGNGRIRGGKLPGGQYAVVQHKGPYDGLVKANAALQDWAKSRGLVMRARTTKLGTVWDGRAEFFLRDPGNEKDPKSYVTEITYAVAGRKVGR